MKRFTQPMGAVLALAIIVAGVFAAEPAPKAGPKTSAPKARPPAKPQSKPATKPKPAPKPAPQPKKPVTPGIFIHGAGLKPHSWKTFAVYQGSRCINNWRARLGRPLNLAPGEYEVRVGFGSGWVATKVQVRPNAVARVPTGLLRFRDVLPPDAPGAVPQKLYHGHTYLATRYRGETCRLPPGEYTVRYHAPSDMDPSTVLRAWHQVGPFPPKRKPPQILDDVWPPEQAPKPGLKAAYKVGKEERTWQYVGARPEGNVYPGGKGTGVFYLTTTIDAKEAGDYTLLFKQCRGGLVAWLNGKQVQRVAPDTRYRPKRVELFLHLAKGKNVLMVKTVASHYSSWQLRGVLTHWRTYQVAVTDDGGKPPAAKPKPPILAGGDPTPAVPGIEGVVFCQVPNREDGRCAMHYEQFRIVTRPSNARICSLAPAKPDGAFRDLTGKRFASAMQPDLSYDGKKVVFTARETTKKDDTFAIYEMNVDGSGLRQVTKNLNHCLDPCYLPSGRILFACMQDFRDEYDRDHPPLLHSCNPDGSDVDQLTFNLSSDTAPVVLADGRVLFTSWQHHGDHEGEAGNFAICTVIPDGTGFNLFCGNSPPMSKTKSYCQQLTDGRVVVVETSGHRHYNAGYLTAVHPRRPLATRQFLTPEVQLNGTNLDGRFASPYPLPDPDGPEGPKTGGMLCAYSPGRGTAQLYEYPFEQIHEGLYTFDFESGRAGRLVFDAPNVQDYDPIAVTKRRVPDYVPNLVVPGAKTGVMCCVNPYLSDRPKQNNRTVVGQLPPAEPGTVKGVRVMEGFGVEDTDPRYHDGFVIDMLQMTFGAGSNGGSNFEQKRIIGYAPTEKDGSFNVEVPADTVISLQTLDANGMAIETQLTWTWVRPGEHRLCVGCHEDREQALPNLDCLAMHKRPVPVLTPPDKRRTVDFRRDIMPIIEKRCSMPQCHGEKTKAGGLDLRKGFELVYHRSGYTGRKINGAFFNRAYESLLQAPPNRIGTLVRPCSARHSPLIWRLYGKQLGWSDNRNPYKKPAKPMPPGKPLPEAEKKLFVEWVDLGAMWDNIPGEDPLPGFDAVESKRMGREATAKLAKPIADAEEAFKVRCFECHDARKNNKMKQMTPDKIPPLVTRMNAKRKGWIKPSELQPIIQYLQQNVCRKK